MRFLTAADDEKAAELADSALPRRHQHDRYDRGAWPRSRAWQSRRREAAFSHFHDRFKNDPLVLDKWMGLQAMSPLPDTIARVRALMKHPAFSLKNPNRVRALIGAFAAGNPLRFHDLSGAGYRLVGEVVQRARCHQSADRGAHHRRLRDLAAL